MSSPSIYSAVIPDALVRDSGGAEVLRGPGGISATAEGDVTLSLSVPRKGDLPSIPDACEIVGTTLDGFEAKAAGAYWRGTSTSCNASTAGLPPLDLSFSPMEVSALRPGADLSNWTRKVLFLKGPRVFADQAWNHGNLAFRLTRFIPPGGSRDARGDVTAELEVRRSGPVVDFEELKIATLALLSLASRVYTRWCYEQTYSEDELVAHRAIPNPGDAYSTHPLIPPEVIGTFMSMSTTGYLNQGRDYSLETVIGYYCRSHQDTLAEAKFIFAGVAMEALKFYWALNVGKLPQDKNAKGLVRGFFRPDRRSRHTFEELMKMLAKHLKLSHLYTFLEERNALFHTGRAASAQLQTGSTWKYLKPELELVHDQLDDILFTIIGYKGPFRRYWEQAVTYVSPGRTKLP